MSSWSRQAAVVYFARMLAAASNREGAPKPGPRRGRRAGFGWIDEASEAGIFLLFFNQAIGQRSLLWTSASAAPGRGDLREGSQKAVQPGTVRSTQDRPEKSKLALARNRRKFGSEKRKQPRVIQARGYFRRDRACSGLPGACSLRIFMLDMG
jgi:hypothetical protein